MVPWRMPRLAAFFLFAVTQAVAVTAAAAAVQVEKVELHEADGTTEVFLAADGELEYNMVSQQEPARVLLQLPDAEMRREALPQGTSKGVIRDLKLHRGNGEPPRLELLLARPAKATASREGTVLNVALTPDGSERPARARTVSAEREEKGGKLRDYAVTRENGETTVLLKTGGSLERFQSFQLDEPKRLVVDLHGTDLALPRRDYPLDHPFIDRIRFGQHSNRTRVVLSLREEVTHALEPHGQGLRVTLTRPRERDAMRRVEEVDFTTGPEPEVGRVTLQLDRTGAEAQVHREKNRVVMDLPKTRVPRKMEKRLDVTDFGTAVDTVDLYQKGEAVRVVASGSDALEAQTYQVEDRLVMDISQPEVSEPAETGPKAAGEPYEGEKLSLNFQDIQVRQALQILANFAKLNIIASESVSGTLTLRLKDVPWDQALDLILDSQGLGMERKGSVIRVAPQAELQKQREQELKAELQKEQLVPLQTEMIQVSYAKASDMKSLLESQGGGGGGGAASGGGSSGLLSGRGSVSVDARTNTLLVRDTPDQIRKVKELVKELDRPTKQVMIEARIVKVNTNYERNLGVRWGGQYSETTDYRFPNSVQASGSLSGAQAGQPDLAVDLPVGGAGGANPASIGMRLGHVANNATLDLELQAIEAEGEGKIISSPRVVTADQQEASIKQGTEIPYQEATSSGATNVSFEEAVLELGVTPQITPDGRLILDVNASNDSVAQQTAAGPAIDTEEVETQVLVDDGETVVIGGIYAKAENEDRTGVPVLRHIPLLGWLFENKTTSTQKNELLIFLTPRIVKEDSLPQEGRLKQGARAPARAGQ